MKTAPIPRNEELRLETLRQAEILDTPPEVSFDRLTDLAARLCGAPIALITLVDVDRQWFKSRVGLAVSETPREVAFCAHAILQPDLLIVRDAFEDVRFADNPLVRSDPKIRFYAGQPLVTHDGHALGTFCVIDIVPRDLDSARIEVLKTLSRHAAVLLELRRAKQMLEAHAAAWESGDTKRDAVEGASSLARMGDFLGRTIEAREQAELAFHDLERSLAIRTGDSTAAEEDVTRDVDLLLGEILVHSGRILLKLVPENPLHIEAARVVASARHARMRIAEVGARRAIHLVHG